jgi:hypothetical protein
MPTWIDHELVVGDTVNFGLAVRLNSLTWDITGATVQFHHRDPSGNWTGPLSATVSDGPGGEALYAAPTTLLDEAGGWVRLWKVTKDGVVKLTQRIEFEVLPGPG